MGDDANKFQDASFENMLDRLISGYVNNFEGGRTPDFVLARYIHTCLDAFKTAAAERDQWNQTCKGCGNPAMPWPDLCADCKNKEEKGDKP